jgi:ribosomal protein L44E
MGNQTITKLSMYCTNCHHTKHNVETYISKKKEPIVVAIEAITWVVSLHDH